MAVTADSKTLQDAIDKLEIGELQSRYMFAIDWADAEVYASLFTEDAILAWPEGHAAGRDAIRTACERMGAHRRKHAAAAEPMKPAQLRHIVTNLVIRIDGDSAVSRSYWFDINNDNQLRMPYVPGYGHYEDELTRTSEGWRFSKRTVYNETTDRSPAENPAW